MLLIVSILSFLGCPLPPEEKVETENIGLSQKNQNMGNMERPQGAPQNLNPSQNQKPMQQGMMASQTAGTENAGGGVLMDMGKMRQQKTQESIKEQEFVTISGEVKGECTGLLRLDVIGTIDLGGPKDGEELKGPITSKELTDVGAFSVIVPKSESISLTVLCDADRNMKITADVDQLSLGARLGVVETDISDVSLILEKIEPPKGDLPPPKEKLE